MNTITETLYIVQAPYSENPTLSIVDMTDQGWAVLGTTQVTVDVPDVDPTEGFIKALETKAETVKQEANEKLASINQQIKELRALEHIK